MRTPLRLAILGYLFLFISLTLIRLRSQLLLLERNRPWVLDIVNKKDVNHD